MQELLYIQKNVWTLVKTRVTQIIIIFERIKSFAKILIYCLYVTLRTSFQETWSAKSIRIILDFIFLDRDLQIEAKALVFEGIELALLKWYSYAI